MSMVSCSNEFFIILPWLHSVPVEALLLKRQRQWMTRPKSPGTRTQTPRRLLLPVRLLLRIPKPQRLRLRPCRRCRRRPRGSGGRRRSGIWGTSGPNWPRAGNGGSPLRPPGDLTPLRSSTLISPRGGDPPIILSLSPSFLFTCVLLTWLSSASCECFVRLLVPCLCVRRVKLFLICAR